MRRDADESPVVALQRELEETREESRLYRLRGLEAEAEVRYLKNRTRHIDTEPTEPNSVGGDRSRPAHLRTTNRLAGHEPDQPSSDATPSQRPVSREFGVQKDDDECKELRQQALSVQSRLAAADELREELRCLQAREASREEGSATSECRLSDSGPVVELEALVTEYKEQVNKKNLTIIQLQADMRRDQQQIERQRQVTDNNNILYREELREMTTRAEMLSDVVKKSRKKGSELQAAKDEIARLQNDIVEYEARLGNQESVNSSIEAMCQEVALEMASSKTAESVAESVTQELRQAAALQEMELHESRSRIQSFDVEQQELEARLNAAAASAAEAREAREEATKQFEESIAASNRPGAASKAERRSGTPTNWQKALQSLSAVRSLHTELQNELQTSRTRSGRETGGAGSAVTAEKAAGKVATQLEQAIQMLESHMSSSQGNRSPQQDKRNQSPQRLQASVQSPNAASQQNAPQVVTDANAALLQQLNDCRLDTERVREEMMEEQADELDDLLRRHDLERRELHREIRELRAHCAHAEAADVVGRPMAEIRTHFEGQVTAVKRELTAQLADLHERQREERGQEERDVERLRRSLRDCQSELASRQAEFNLLSNLYDKDRRENCRLKSHHRALEVHRQMTREASSDAAVDQAAVATIASSHDMTPETTEDWDKDTLHVVPERTPSRGMSEQDSSRGQSKDNPAGTPQTAVRHSSTRSHADAREGRRTLEQPSGLRSGGPPAAPLPLASQQRLHSGYPYHLRQGMTTV